MTLKNDWVHSITECDVETSLAEDSTVFAKEQGMGSVGWVVEHWYGTVNLSEMLIAHIPLQACYRCHGWWGRTLQCY